jgi:uncharacterized protein (TIGR03435 family)
LRHTSAEAAENISASISIRVAGVANRDRLRIRLFIVAAFVVLLNRPAAAQAVAAPGANSSYVAAGAADQTPTYEVATIKPPGPNDYAQPLYQYIQVAYGIQANSKGWVFGPEWVNSAKYVIKGKISEAEQVAMHSMSVEDRRKVNQQMMQALLAERFKLKAHFETREMPMYRLTVAKGGPKLKEDPDTRKGVAAVGASTVRGTAVPLHNFIEMLESLPDVGGRVIVDDTGLTGTYDFVLKWAPLEPTASSGGGATTEVETETLFTAIEEQLGLKLTATKGPGQVLVIDSIERPNEN